MTTAVVVTGMGVVAPSGLGTDAYWAAALRGDSGIGPLDRFDTGQYPVKLAGQVKDFDAGPAAEDHYPPDRRGVFTAATSGGYDFGQRELQNLWEKGPQHVSAYQSFAWFYAVNTGQIGIRHDMRGPSGVVIGDHAGGLDAIGRARRGIRKGAGLMITGAVDSSLSPWGWVGHVASGRATTAQDPERAYLPFDAEASGYVPAEGGAIFVLESADAARERGARIHGEVAGYAATFDPAPGSHGEPGLRRAAELALADAELTPSDIGVVFADACGVPRLDKEEAEALTAVFGPRGVPVTAPKSRIGRCCAGGAPLDVATALLALREGFIPPTAPRVRLAPGIELDLVTGEPRPVSTGAALVLARGHGGFNAGVVLRAAP